MTKKSDADRERLWDIEDKFGALVGTAIGDIRPVSVTPEHARKPAAKGGSPRIRRPAPAVERPKAPKISSFRRSGASQDSSDYEELGKLVQTYWQSIFSFVCSWGYSIREAEDITQDFFVALLKGRLLESRGLEEGRLRALILGLLKNFLVTKGIERKMSEHGLKSLAETSPSTFEPFDVSLSSGAKVTRWTSELQFDVRWAATVAERALQQVAEQYARAGKQKIFNVIRKFLVAENITEDDYNKAAQKIGVRQENVRMQVARLRQEYRKILRAEVANTVQQPSQIDEELRYLCDALSGAGQKTREPQCKKWLSTHRLALVGAWAELWGKTRLVKGPAADDVGFAGRTQR